MPRAEAAALKALEIDPDLAAGHVSLGAVKSLFYWDWEAGEREFRRAIELDAAYPVARTWHAVWVLSPVSRLAEAYAECTIAVELDPVTPVINVCKGLVLILQRKFDQANQELQKCLDLDANFFVTHLFLGMAHVHNGDRDEAIDAFKRGNVPSFRDGHLGYAYAVFGETEKARQMIAELEAGSQPEHLAPYHLAMIHLGLGEKDEALKRLAEACDLRSPSLFWINSLAEVDSVRDDPRFQAILRRMNLAP